MPHELLHVANTGVNVDHVTHCTFDGEGGCKLFLSNGACVDVTGDDADTLAKKFGRHDARHVTAKAARADAKAEAEAAKAAEPAPEPEPKSKAHGGHGAHK
jgi:hypothetical protein